MAEPGGDDGGKIDGVPGQMTSVKLAGPALMNPVADLEPGLPEGKAFVVKDKKASENLQSFVLGTNREFESYAKTARDAGQDYDASDVKGGDHIQNVYQHIYA